MVKMLWFLGPGRGAGRSAGKILSDETAIHGVTAISASMIGQAAIIRVFGLPLPAFLHLTARIAGAKGKEGDERGGIHRAAGARSWKR